MKKFIEYLEGLQAYHGHGSNVSEVIRGINMRFLELQKENREKALKVIDIYASELPIHKPNIVPLIKRTLPKRLKDEGII